MPQYLYIMIFETHGLEWLGTYIDSRRLSFNNGSLKENVFIYEAKIFVEFGDRAGEDPLRC